jgi:5-methylcytosine-specific restriction endonuclease McrA
MRSRLRANEPCPLHQNSRRCLCHGQAVARESKARKPSGPVRRIDDPHHPRGWRELCSPAEMKRRKDKLLRDHHTCAGCGEHFTSYDEVELAHKVPKGGGKRDDSWENLCLMHKAENREQGSRSLEQYLADKVGRESAPAEDRQGS